MSRARFPAVIIVAFALAVGLLACGGDDDGGGARDVVDRTFTGDHDDVSSGRFAITFEAEGRTGSFGAEARGAFQNEDDGFPQFDIDAHLTGTGGEGLDFRGALISTGERGFVTYEGTDYEIDPGLFGLFTSYYESLEDESGEDGAGLTEQLGFDPKSWLTNLEDEGQADVGGTETDHVSGEIDLDRVTADLRSLADRLESQLGALGGVGGTSIPDASELDDLAELAESATFDLYSGTEDHILRRFDVSVELRPGGGDSPETIDLSIVLSEVNEEQSIEAPTGARPFRELLDRLGVSDDLRQLGQVGGINTGPGGGSGGGGSGDGGSEGGGSGGAAPSPDAFEDYTRCLQSAKSPADIDRCNALL